MNLDKRLTALELIAEHCRIREYERILRDEMVRRYEAAGVPLPVHEMESKVMRALALAARMQSLADEGMTLDVISRRVAIEHDLDPDRVASIFASLQAERR